MLAALPIFLALLLSAVTVKAEPPRDKPHLFFEPHLLDVSLQPYLVWAFVNGTPRGVKLFAIKPASPYAKAGLKNGDVVRRIDGQDATPRNLLPLVTLSRDGGFVTLDIERSGQARLKRYRLRVK